MAIGKLDKFKLNLFKQQKFEMRDLITAMKNCDYSLESLRSFEVLLHNHIKEFHIPHMRLPKGKFIYRCRRNSQPFSPYLLPQDLSYIADSQKIESFGRCNAPKSNKFYGSVSLNQGEKGYLTSILETSELTSSPDLNSEGYEVYTFGMWEILEDIVIPAIKPSVELPDNNVGAQVSNRYDEIVGELQNQEERKEFYSFINEEFSKAVAKENNQSYGISALTAELLMQGAKGLLYPSIKTNQETFNIVLTPECVDNYLRLKRVGVVDFFKFGSNNSVASRNLLVADHLEGKELSYRKVPKENSMPLSIALNTFLDEGISLDYILAKVPQGFFEP
jgi:hypothetical protein